MICGRSITGAFCIIPKPPSLCSDGSMEKPKACRPAMPRNLPVPESQKILMILSVGGSAPAGVIQKELSTLLPVEMFRENGALAGTVIRGLGNRWEQPLSAIFTDLQRREQKISVKEQLKKQSEAKAVRHKKENQQER